MALAPHRPRLAPLEVLRQVMVRPIVPVERVRWDALMRAHHYLGLQALVGHSLRYVAVVGDAWLALLGWQAAALKCTARDRWIGWPPWLQYQRLPLIANNARFLILPDVRVPNLASRVLSLTVKRLGERVMRMTPADEPIAVDGKTLAARTGKTAPKSIC